MPSISPARVVALLTPILAAGSAALTPWLVKYTGLHISPTDVTALAVAGATSVTGIGLKFLHGQSLWERDAANVAAYASHTMTLADAVDPGLSQKVTDGIASDVQAAESKAVEAIADIPGPTAAQVQPVAADVPAVVTPVAAVPEPAPVA